jgi:S-adenosylmethionine synthetase
MAIRELGGPVPGIDDVEIVERKGLGHPDTLCDALAEELSVALCRYYLEHFDVVLHHNVDKVLLWGGVSRPAFGAGEVLEPMELFLAGRATTRVGDATVPVTKIAQSTCESWIDTHFHALDPKTHVKIHPLIRPGSSELVELFMHQKKTGVWLANDTSCGVGYAPASNLERVTLAVENALNSSQTRTAHPELGEDVKVMSVRNGGHMDLTVACAMIGRYLNDIDDYLQAKELVARIARDAAAPIHEGRLSIAVNTADDPDRERVYLTVTGTSAESGDDGQAGRGNRANGLITPFRPMTLEAVAGKNPMTHVGKLYNLAAREIASALVSSFPELIHAQCALVSQIGRPVNEPRIVDVRVRTDGSCPLEGLDERIRECVRDRVEETTHLWHRVIRGEIPLY